MPKRAGVPLNIKEAGVEPPCLPLLSQYAKHLVPSPIRKLLASGKLPEDVTSFMAGFPNSKRMPTEYFGDLYQQFSHEPNAGEKHYQYTGGVGEPYFRELLASRMKDFGANVEWKDVVVAAGGSQSLIDVWARNTIDPGLTTVFVQPFTYPGMISAIAPMQPRGIETLPMKADGTLDSDAFEARLIELKKETRGKDPDHKEDHPHAAMAISSYFANPMGTSMTATEIRDIARLARQYGIPILDDLAYRRLNFVPGQAKTGVSLQGLLPELVMETGTFSKEAAPHFRMGWSSIPKFLQQSDQMTMELSNLCPSMLNQRILYTYLKDPKGYATVFEQELLPFYAHNQELMVEGVKEHFPAGTMFAADAEPEGSIFVSAILPDGYDTGALLPGAIEEAKVAYMAGLGFAQDPAIAKRMIRMSFSNNEPEEVTSGITRLGAYFRNHQPAAA